MKAWSKLKQRKLTKWNRYLKGASLGNLGFCTSWAVDHNHGTAPEWIEVVEVDLHLPKLADALGGKRIVHISDLHCSRTVSSKYLIHCIERVNLLDADIVVMTGDFVTHDIYGKFRDKVTKLVGKIQSRHGTFACLGNHDYGIGSVFGSYRNDLLSRLIDGFEACGVKMLRNESTAIEIDGKSLWLAGLGDIWAKDFYPEKAFENVTTDLPVIALTHNPDTAIHLKAFPADVCLSGHTHGVQTRLEPSPGWKMKKRNFHAGLYEVGKAKLYVNRGLGRLGRFLHNARPEITVFTLK